MGMLSAHDIVPVLLQALRCFANPVHIPSSGQSVIIVAKDLVKGSLAVRALKQSTKNLKFIRNGPRQKEDKQIAKNEAKIVKRVAFAVLNLV